MTALAHPEMGCWGDGALGHQHTRERCGTTIAHFRESNFTSRGLTPPEGTAALIEALDGPMSDDAREEYEACDWLNEHAPFTGATWGWQDGDFGLWPDDEGE